MQADTDTIAPAPRGERIILAEQDFPFFWVSIHCDLAHGPVAAIFEARDRLIQTDCANWHHRPS